MSKQVPTIPPSTASSLPQRETDKGHAPPQPLPDDEGTRRDGHGRLIPAFELDRRTVKRPKSPQPTLTDVIPTYIAARRLGGGANIERDLSTEQSRLALFIELIGDRPVDTYRDRS